MMTGAGGHSGGFGPWSPDLAPDERAIRLRTMRAVAHLIAGAAAPITVALTAAERDPSALPRAAAELDHMPALRRRRLLATYAALSSPPSLAPRGAANRR